jgi:hypothetical protein
MHPVFKKSGAVVAAAAVVALAANGVSYATTGNSLIGGHHNATQATTTIADSGQGPALSLVSSGNGAPSLRVSSDAVVPRLNASMVGGVHAAGLTSNATSFTAGYGSNRQFTNYVVYGLDIGHGIYNVSFNAVVVPSTGDAGNPIGMECGVYSGNFVRSLASTTTEYAGAILPQMSGSSVVRIGSKGALFACWTSGTTAQFYQPARISFIRLNSLHSTQAPVSTGKSQHLRAFGR